MTLHSCDLNYSPSMRSYQAPLHLKANGGVFLIDDFGRQRVEPHQLLNRWIVPLEHQIDYQTLITGQKIQVPFLLMLIVATNLKPESVTDAAFLRRTGYRVCLDRPTPELYEQIFRSYAGRYDAAVPHSVITWLLERYQKENRELRGCEPRDLIERARDICKYYGRPLELSEEILHQAWAGYFGTAV
jgi:predicted ATPase with chaperone activity